MIPVIPGLFRQNSSVVAFASASRFAQKTAELNLRNICFISFPLPQRLLFCRSLSVPFVKMPAELLRKPNTTLQSYQNALHAFCQHCWCWCEQQCKNINIRQAKFVQRPSLSHTQFGFGSATAVETVETAVVVVLVYNGVRIKGRSLGGCWAWYWTYCLQGWAFLWVQTFGAALHLRKAFIWLRLLDTVWKSLSPWSAVRAGTVYATLHTQWQYKRERGSSSDAVLRKHITEIETVGLALPSCG